MNCLQNISVTYLFCYVGVIVLLIFCLKTPDNLWSYGLYWYTFVLIMPGLCIAISQMMFFWGKFRVGRGAIVLIDLGGS